MAKPLVIVESPAKAKTIAGYLGERLHGDGERRPHPRPPAAARTRSPTTRRRRTAASRASTPTTTSTPSTSCTDNKKKVVAELKQALKGADELILATDEDREGEAIGWHVLEVLQAEGARCKRMVFHEITPHAIREALDNPRELDMKLVEAQEGRRILDRLVGWETSPVLWRVFGRGQAASAGRVQSVAVRHGRRARARAHGVPLRPVARPRRHVRRATTRRSAPSLVELDGKRARRRPRLRPRDRRDRRRTRRTTSCCSTPTRAAGARRPAARRRRSRSRRSSPIRSPSGRGRRSPRRRCSRSRAASCGFTRVAHDGGRAAPLRARLHHLHAYRQHEPVGAGDHRGAHRDPRAVRRRVPARRAARVPQQGEERAGGARGDPARRRRHPHARRRCAPSSTATSSGSTS